MHFCTRPVCPCRCHSVMDKSPLLAVVEPSTALSVAGLSLGHGVAGCASGVARWCARADATTVAERLYYEGVVQELGHDCDLLYVCPSNSALAHLPYLVALDNTTRCATTRAWYACCVRCGYVQWSLHGRFASPTDYSVQAKSRHSMSSAPGQKCIAAPPK